MRVCDVRVVVLCAQGLSVCSVKRVCVWLQRSGIKKDKVRVEDYETEEERGMGLKPNIKFVQF